MKDNNYISKLQEIKKNIQNNTDILSGTFLSKKEYQCYFITNDSTVKIKMPNSFLNKLMHGDKITVSVINKTKFIELISINDLGIQFFVGEVINIENGKKFLRVDHFRVHNNISIYDSNVRNGDFLYCERIINNDNKSIKVIINNNLGSSNDSGFEQLYALCHKNLINYNVDKSIKINTNNDDLYLYKDYTHIPFVTIDSESTKDMDDAVYIQSHNDGWNIKVAISDVARILDDNLLEKIHCLGQSLYLPGFVMPMIDEKISQEYLSLKPLEIKKCIIININCNLKGNIESTHIELGLIKSHAKLSYFEVNNFMEGWDKDLFKSRYPEIWCSIKDLYRLYITLNDKFDNYHYHNNEYNIMIDQCRKKAFDIKKQQKMISHEAIANVMILTNFAVTKYMNENEIPSIYRVYSDFKNKSEAQRFINEFIPLNIDSINIYNFKELINNLMNLDYGKHMVSTLLSYLNKSTYSTVSKPHFSMGLPYYLTITSPIRKSTDLINQKNLREFLISEKKYINDKINLDKINLSVRNIQETQKFCEDLFRMQFAQDVLFFGYKNLQLEAEITKVNENGIFVKTLDHGLKGYIHKSKIVSNKSLFKFDELLKTASIYKEKIYIGKKITVKTIDIDRNNKSIDFDFIRFN